MTAESKPYNSGGGGIRILSRFLQAVIMVVVLALFFLFARIASVVLLHLFVAARALRLRRRSSEGAGSGLSRADLKRIPCFSFRGGGDRAGSDSGCAVCLEGFKKGDRCRVLPGCRHCYHKGCVDKWLVRTRACPLCRSCVSVGGSERGRSRPDGPICVWFEVM
ncbi:hypothetical protein QJS10_CPA05g02290 [Acorus calamus]|uniref:RING-type domain-containing protein n=1 Tax=Acorus calamus TaxID=4465 RepID=A0AAV9EUI2_ACOCL|nr:hypothetical protein QJS10_CPA05g02290 [Acorus calamus]